MKEKHYFDSCIFIGFLNAEHEEYNSKECIQIIEAGEDGAIEVYTSTFSLAEVAKLKGRNSDEQIEAAINSLFNLQWINLIAFERETAEVSRHLTRKYNLKPFDALHLATAIRHGVDYFDTVNENDFMKKSVPGRVGFLPLYKEVTIQRPIAHGYTPRIV